MSETTRCTGRYGLTNQHQCGCVESHSGECRPSNAWESCILRLIDERDASRAREERLRGALERLSTAASIYAKYADDEYAEMADLRDSKAALDFAIEDARAALAPKKGDPK